jgi:hypothetical protein
MKDVRIGLIGTGGMGKAHATAFRNVPLVFGSEPGRPIPEIVADVDAKAVERWAGEFGFARWTTDWREVVADPRVDVVDITTPNHLHAEMAIAAAEAGKHVYCEKPLATTSSDAARIVAAVERSKVISLVGFNYLKNPAQAFARELIAAGELGEITLFRGVFDQDFLTDPQITPAEAKKLRNASEKIENLNGRLNVANQQLAELKANPKTKPSQIIAKEQEITRLTNDRDNAVDDFNRLQQEVLVAHPGKGRGRGGLDGSGINPALADNPYYKLMMAEQMKQEAYAGIMPDPGQLADIGIGGLKESFLPPGFSDPQTWGVTQAASGLLNFLGGIMPDPISGGLLSMGGAALGGSGSGMASAIRGMIPKPFGSLEIGSPDEAPGIPGYDTSGMPVPGRRLPIGQVPGMPRGDAAANSAGNVYNDNRIQVTGGNDGLANKARDNMTAQQAPIARRNIGKYARGST